jgi:La domain
MSNDNTTISNKESVTDNNEVVYRALARQLEYYFSSQNLAVDTYLQTLRELNDGCVPISIIANFSKVKSIASQLTPQTSATATSTSSSSSSSSRNSSASSNTTTGNGCQGSASTSHHDTAPSSSDVPSLIIDNHVSSSTSSVTPRLIPPTEPQSRIDAIVRVIQPAYTEQLQIYDIDSRTGKITDPHNNNNNSSSSSTTTSTILAIGFKAGCQPKDCGVEVKKNEISTHTTTTDHNMTSSSPSVSLDDTNTLILRDVDPNVSECEIRSILEAIDDCPTIINLVPDIAACW